MQVGGTSLFDGRHKIRDHQLILVAGLEADFGAGAKQLARISARLGTPGCNASSSS